MNRYERLCNDLQEKRAETKKEIQEYLYYYDNVTEEERILLIREACNNYLDFAEQRRENYKNGY